MAIELDKAAREALAEALARHLRDEFDMDLGRLQAGLLLDFIAEKLGPYHYNQALRDARALFSAKADALGELFYELEKPEVR
jgi:uncharacterized protein (DUF2164 family)